MYDCIYIYICTHTYIYIHNIVSPALQQHPKETSNVVNPMTYKPSPMTGHKWVKIISKWQQFLHFCQSHIIIIIHFHFSHRRTSKKTPILSHHQNPWKSVSFLIKLPFFPWTPPIFPIKLPWVRSHPWVFLQPRFKSQWFEEVCAVLREALWVDDWGYPHFRTPPYNYVW